MATNNTINAPLPLVVGQGGTGAISLTDHAVLIGSGSGAITAITPGGSGELLTGVTGADPAFATSSDGNFAFTSATAGTDRILTVSNTDNTNAASAATLQVSTGGASAGDPATIYTVTGAQSYTFGIDNSDADKLKIANSTALGTTDSWIMTTAGVRTMPLQPAFLVHLNSAILNETGDGTSYKIVWDTEDFDQGANFSSTTFTAPVAGKYRFEANLTFSGLLNTHISGYIQIATTARSYLYQFDPYAYSNNTKFGSCFSVLADMAAGDTVFVNASVSGGTKVVDLLGVTGANVYCWFSGNLEC